MKKTDQQKAALKFLKKHIKPQTEIVIALHSVSQSGMTRKMSVYALHKNKLVYLNGYIRHLGLRKLDKNHHIIVGGCGMDMCFALQNQIMCTLYPKAGFHDLTQRYQLIA